MMAPSSKRKSIDFDQWAPTYESSRNQRFYDRIHDIVLTFVANSAELGSLLDVGCGTGRLLRAAKARWPNATLTGIDPSPRMVETAHHLLPDATFHVGEAEALPLPDTSVDVVLSTVSFHHWRDQLAGVREVGRVLRPEGVFFLADVSPLTWPFLWLLRQPRSQTPAEMRSVFRKAGLPLFFQRFVVAGSVLVTAGVKSLP